MASNPQSQGQADPMVGVSVAEYQVVEALGGTAGCVYKAIHTASGKPVVLKFLPDGLSGDPIVVERFRSQAKALSAIHHPSVVTVLGSASATHRHYVAMEFAEGSTLQCVIAEEEALPAERALALIKEIASGLGALHDAGLVHGNVQPAHVIVGPNDTVTLIGLGLVREPRSGDEEIRTDGLGVRLPPHPPEDGTAPAYYPPEVARGRPLDARSDLYQLGGAFYHMLVGKPPFEADTAESLALRYIREDIPSIDQSLRKAPVLLCRLLDRLLKRDPDARYQSPAEAIEAIERVESMFARKADTERKAAAERRAAIDLRAAERARARRKKPERKKPERNEPGPDETAAAAAAVRLRRKAHRPWLKPTLFGVLVLALVGSIAALLLATGGGGDEREPVLPKHMADALAADKAKLEGKRAPTAPKAPAKTARKTPRKTVPKARKPPPPIRGHCRTATTDLGGLARYEREKDCTGFWVDDSMVYWTVDVERTGLYEVEIHYAGDKEVEGNVIEISLADEKIHVPIKVTGSWETFVKVTAPDRLKATKGQKRTLSVRPFKKQKGKGLVNLRSVILTWVGEAP